MKHGTDIIAECLTYNDDGQANGVALRDVGGLHPFVTHMFCAYEDARDYFHGHYFKSLREAREDFRKRCAEHI